MPEEVPPEIAKLPIFAKEIGKSIVQGADRIFHVGFTKPSFLRSIPFETYFLNHIKFDWTFFIVKTTKSSIAFFFKKKKDQKELIYSKVSIVFRLWDVQPHILASNPLRLSYYYRLPPFIPHFTTQDDIDAYAPRESSNVTPTLENTLTIALGDRNQNILSVLQPRSLFDARVRYTPKKGPPKEFRGKEEWPVVVIIQVIETLRKWAQKKFQEGTLIPFTPSYPKDGQTADKDDKNDVVHAVIEQISKSYFEANNAMLHDNDTIFKSGSDLGVGYGVDDFEAMVRMRLNENGELTDKDEDNPFYLNFNLAVEQESGSTNAFVNIGPPDFLVKGDIRQLFLDALTKKNETIVKIKKQLKDIHNKKEYETIFSDYKIQITENEIKAFMQKARQDSVVFRTLHKKKKDRDVFFLKADFNAIPFYMILCADFIKKKRRAGFTVTLDKSTLKVLYFLPVKYRLGNIEDKQVGKHLLLLLVSIHRWIEILD